MTVPLYLFTFNCNRRPQDKEVLVSKLSESLPDQCATLYVFGFEEMCPIMDGAFPDVANGHLINLSNILLDSLHHKYGSNATFQTIAMTHVGAIGLVVISPFASKFNNIKLATASCGWFYSSLKGAAGVRLAYRDDSSGEMAQFSFANAHLTANEGDVNWDKRNHDVINMMRGLDFDDSYGLVKPNNHCFFMGDLNFRTRSNSVLGETGQLLAQFQDIDELTLAKENGEIFGGFSEAQISFAPTYKFKVGTDIYSEKRNPSWCDRILYQSTYPHGDVKIHKYDSIKGIYSSDHQPVYLSITVPTSAPNSIIDSRGFLMADMDNKRFYMRPTAEDALKSRINTIVDAIMGYGLYTATDSKMRLYIIGFVCLWLLWYRYY